MYLKNLDKALIDKKKNLTQKDLRVSELTFRKNLIKNNKKYNQNSPEMSKKSKRMCPKRNKKLSEYVQKERTQMCKKDITRHHVRSVVRIKTD